MESLHLWNPLWEYVLLFILMLNIFLIELDHLLRLRWRHNNNIKSTAQCPVKSNMFGIFLMQFNDSYSLDSYSLDSYSLDSYSLDSYSLDSYSLDSYSLETLSEKISCQRWNTFRNTHLKSWPWLGAFVNVILSYSTCKK